MSIIARLEGLTPGLLSLSGYRRRWVETDAGQIHMLSAQGRGSGPPLLFLHGLGSRASDYALLMRQLRGHTRLLLAPDVPGHGDSPPPPGGLSVPRIEAALIAAVDAVLDEPAVVLGNSMGGFAAVRLAHALPEKVRALVLVSPGGAPVDDLAGFLRRFELRTRDDASRFVDQFLGRPSRIRPLLVAGVRSRVMAPGPRQLVAQLRPEDQLRPSDLSDLSVPVLVFWGRDDGVLGPEQLAFFRRHLPPHAVITTPQGYGHAPYLDSTAGFASRVIRFLEVQGV